MESLHEYMDKVLHLLKELDEKDKIVTEGVTKIRKCGQIVEKAKIDSKKEIARLNEQCDKQQDILNSRQFKLEQLTEKCERLKIENDDREKQIEARFEKMNETMEREIENWNKDLENLSKMDGKQREEISTKLTDLTNQMAI